MYIIELAKERHGEINELLMKHSRRGGLRIGYISKNRVTPLIVDIEIWIFRRLVKLNHQLFDGFMLHIREIIGIITNVNC